MKLSLDELVNNPTLIQQVPPDQCRTLWLDLMILEKAVIAQALTGTPGAAEDDPLLTIAQVAERLQLSTYRCYELCRTGSLKSIHVGKAVRVRTSDLLAYLAQQGT